MEAEAKPLFHKGTLPAPTTPAEQYLQLILGELCAIRELLVAEGLASLAPAAPPVALELREPKPKQQRAKG
jgi:hypothetical protein